MKYVLWITTLFSLSLLSWGDTVDELNEISNNAYVKLYEQWVALDLNQVTRLELIKENAHIELNSLTRRLFLEHLLIYLLKILFLRLTL